MAKLDVEQLKNGESFQFGKVPWRSELREMQAAVGTMEPYGKSEEENVEQKRALPKINILGRDAEIIAEYYQGRLREVVLNTSHQNAKKAEEYAQDLLDELEALWGEEAKVRRTERRLRSGSRNPEMRSHICRQRQQQRRSV